MTICKTFSHPHLQHIVSEAYVPKEVTSSRLAHCKIARVNLSDVPQMSTDFRVYSNISRNRILSTFNSTAATRTIHLASHHYASMQKKLLRFDDSYHFIVVLLHRIEIQEFCDRLRFHCIVHPTFMEDDCPVEWQVLKQYYIRTLRSKNYNLTVISHNGDIVSRIVQMTRAYYMHIICIIYAIYYAL